MIKFLLATIILFISFMAHSQMVINELLADNNNWVYEPETEKYPDYIELYNTGEASIDISGYGLSDNPSSPHKWRFPSGTSIAGHSFIVVWADGENFGLHTNFKLSKDGEHVLLTNASGQIIDQIDFGVLQENISLSRKPDGNETWRLFSQPTPEVKNVSPELPVVPELPEPHLRSGFYTTSQQLQFTAKQKSEIRYTLHGEEPSQESPIYSGAIELTETSVCRAACFIGSEKGPTVTVSIFIDERNFDLPVVSITTDPDNFFSDETGIYVKGTNGIANNCIDEPVNWNQDWRRPIYFEYFSTDGIPLVQANADVRIMGGCSRIFPQKSLTISAEGDPFQYPFFKDREAQSYKSIVLRNSGNDWGGGPTGEHYAGTMLRDAYIQNLVKDQMDIDYQAYQPVAVFLNGQYWGLHNMREHLNEDYLKNIHPAIDENNIDLIKNHWDIKEGDRNERSKLETYLSENDLSIDEHYQFVCSAVDIDEYINYQITELFLSNGDWPGNNVRFWRERTPESKWRFILYDTDYGFGIWDRDVNKNDLASALDADGPYWPNPPYSTLLFRKLMENEQFKNLFIQRMSVQLDNCFSETRIDSVLTALKAGIRTEIPYHFARWYQYLNTIEAWEQNTQQMATWAKERRAAMASMVQEYFSLQDQVTIELSANISKSTKITAAGSVLNNWEQTIRVFPAISITVRSLPEDGFLFSHWEDANGSVISTDIEYRFIPDSNSTLTAILIPRPEPSNLIINEVLASNTGIVYDQTGSSADYIELFNAGTDTIHLSGLYVTDKPQELTLFQIPHTTKGLYILPGGYKLLWADGAPEKGPDHIGFKLDKKGGAVIVSSANNGIVSVIDQVSYAEQAANIATGRYSVTSPIALPMIPTPEKENSALEGTAKLLKLSCSGFPLSPAFHPDSLVYSVAIPATFRAHLSCSAIAYGSAQVEKDSSASANTITVTLADKSATNQYTISVVEYNPVSTFLHSVAPSEGFVVSGFDKKKLVHTILVESETVPVIQWVLENNSAVGEYSPAKSFNDTTKIIVRAPHQRTMEYCFVFDTVQPRVTGFTYNLTDKPSYWFEASSSYSTQFANGLAIISVDKTKPWDGISLDFGGTLIDLTDYPYLELGITSTADCELRVDLQTPDGTSTNGGAVTVAIDGGKSKSYLFTYIYKFWQSSPAFSWVDSSQIDNIWLNFDPGKIGLKSQITIDYIKIGSHVIFGGENSFDGKILVSSGQLYPPFDKDVFQYSVLNYSGTPQLFATLTGDENAVVEIFNFDGLRDNATAVVSKAGTDDRVYYFTLKPNGLSSNAFLLNLWVQDAELSPEFTAEDTMYKTVGYNHNRYRVFAEAEDPFTDVTVIQAPSIYQKSYVIVTAEDGSKKNYRIAYPVVQEDPDPQTSPTVSTNITVYHSPETNDFLFTGSEQANTYLYDQMGRLVFSVKNVLAETSTLLPNLPAGVYFLQITVGQEQKVFSIWVE